LSSSLVKFPLYILLRDLLVCVIICHCDKWLPQHLLTGFIIYTFKKVEFKVDIKNITTKILNRVIKRKNMNMFTIFNIETLMNIDKITELNTEIIISNFVHLNSTILDIIRAQTDR